MIPATVHEPVVGWDVGGARPVPVSLLGPPLKAVYCRSRSYSCFLVICASFSFPINPLLK